MSLGTRRSATDETGTVRFQNIFPGQGELELHVAREGFAGRRVPLPPWQQMPVTVRLQRGVTATVRVVDHHGSPAKIAAWITWKCEDTGETIRVHRRAVAKGVWRFSDVRPGPVTVHTGLGGEQRWDSRNGELVLHLPLFGRLRVESVPASDGERWARLLLNPVPGTTAAREPATVLLHREGEHLVHEVHLPAGRYRPQWKDEDTPLPEIQVAPDRLTRIELPRGQ